MWQIFFPIVFINGANEPILQEPKNLPAQTTLSISSVSIILLWVVKKKLRVGIRSAQEKIINLLVDPGDILDTIKS